MPIEQDGTEGTIIETEFIRTRRQLLVIVQQDNVNTDEIKERCEALYNMAQEEAMDIMARLLDRYMAVKDNKNSERLTEPRDR